MATPGVAKDGNVFAGGSASFRSAGGTAPFVQGFGRLTTGFLAKLSGDLSKLLFESPLGDNERFIVESLSIARDGSVAIAGASGVFAPDPINIWVNSLTIAVPPALRIDSVENAASHLTDPITVGETIAVRGAGFDEKTELLIDGTKIQVLSVSADWITAVTPQSLPAELVKVQVRRDGALSNEVLTAVAVTAPGLFSLDGTGTGPGYILNEDGTVNSAENPAGPREKITLFVTGVGAVSFNQGYAEPVHPVSVYLEGDYRLGGDFSCPGVAAVMRPVSGLPGDVFQLTVRVPDSGNTVFPALLPIVLTMEGGRPSRSRPPHEAVCGHCQCRQSGALQRWD